MSYDIIVADPPWRFTSNSALKPGRNARGHYACMPVSEIAALNIWESAADHSLLLLWVTAPHLHTGLDLLARVGFAYKTNLVWVKGRIGTGFWARNRHEHVLVGRRGRFPCPKPAPFPDSVIAGQQREHSRKPEALQDMVDRVWPDARKLEIFARQQRAGWDAWGNETEKFS